MMLWHAAFFGVLIWSFVEPKDRFTWLLEVFPALIGYGILAATYKRFPLTSLAYWLILVHACILFVGGHYTYAEVPLGNFVRDLFHQSRNNYDKLGHFAQGFVPAIIARELFIRLRVVKHGAWMFFIVCCVCLGISAIYEFIEWFTAVASGEASDAFLGTQGYVWDTQSDMLFALVGALAAQLLLARTHDVQIEKTDSSRST
jgi:putative membrane protein